MGAFEFNCSDTANVSNNTRNTLKDECLIAFKVYDSCRQQDCLTCDVLGGARAAETTTLCGIVIQAGETIDPPSNAASVSIEDVTISNIIVTDKTPNPFRNGFWDVTIKYVFTYTLIFREADGSLIGTVLANSIFNKKVTLFGSVGSDITLSTDLFSSQNSESFNVTSNPFILVEAKAVALSAELQYNKCCCDPAVAGDPTHVNVTIGLFTIIKLFRIVNLNVQSKGFCIPEQCEDVSSALSPCEFFDSLDFPLDIFSPPQKQEFLAGISSNIPNTSNTSNNTSNNCSCGCGNSCSCGNSCGNGNSCGCGNSCSNSNSCGCRR